MIDEKNLIEDLIPLLNEYDDMILSGRIIGIIDRQPKVSDWIPVSERLPENYKEVLVQWEMINRVQNTVIVYTSVGLIDEHGEWVNSDVMRLFNGRIIAWQPLPEPYKAGEQE